MSIAIHPDTAKKVHAHAKRLGIKPPEALDRLINTAESRLGALRRYAETHAGKAKPKKGSKKTKKNGKK